MVLAAMLALTASAVSADDTEEQLGLRVEVRLPHVSVTAGWRYVKMHSWITRPGEETVMDFSVSGPTATLAVSRARPAPGPAGPCRRRRPQAPA